MNHITPPPCCARTTRLYITQSVPIAMVRTQTIKHGSRYAFATKIMLSLSCAADRPAILTENMLDAFAVLTLQLCIIEVLDPFQTMRARLTDSVTCPVHVYMARQRENQKDWERINHGGVKRGEME